MMENPAKLSTEFRSKFDLVQPDTYFINENHARGFVWSMFVKRAKKYSKSE